MCGIVASLETEGFLEAVNSVRHRGTEEPVFVGPVCHVRLPIVGLGEEGRQPVRIGPWIVAFVGELLDFKDYDSGLESDAPLVARMWAESRWEQFTRHDGFWSVVAYHEQDKSLYLLADYLAQKPLYYREHPTAVASEPDALLAFGLGTPAQNELYLADVAKWGYCPDPRATPWEGIHRVLPGEYVVLNKYGIIRRAIVDPLTPNWLPPSRLREEIERAVQRRVLSADVPVACLLSGGLDSSIVYTLAKRWADVRPYHVNVDEEDTRWAGLVKMQDPPGPLTPWTFSPPDWDRLMEASKVVEWMKEPIDLGSVVPQIALAEVVKERVCLTGDGADEFFGGYGRALRYDSQQSDVWRELVCYHLPRLDRVMMRRKIEVRSPFLARRVCQIALGLPWGARRGKAVLRELFREILPTGLTERAKTPLRTATVAGDREAWSLRLIAEFKARVYNL